VSEAVRRAAARIAEWRRDPVLQVVEEFHVEPDAWQVDVLRAFANPEQQRIAMQACAGPGKSAVMAWCAWNFLSCYAQRNEHPNAAAVSITGDNLKDNFWKEMAVWRGRSEYLQYAFEWTQTRVFAKDHPETWFMSARSWPQTADMDKIGRTLSGLHSAFIAYFIDESGDIPPAVLRSAEQGLSNCRWGKILQAGNPTSHDGTLHQSVVDQAEMWFVVRITGDPDDAKRSPRIDAEWARQQIRLYGRDNPWVMAYILGLFPPGSIAALLSGDEVRAAMERGLHEEDYAWAQKRLGIDCARFGDDRTVIFPRQGLRAFNPVVLRNKRGPEIAARIMEAKMRWGAEMELIDETGGWGQSTIDALYAAGQSPVGVQFHAPAIDPRYANRRAEGWWQMAEWVKRGGALPNIPELVGELTAVTYTFQKGQLLMEPKDQVKKRLGRSPDLADALALTFMLPDMPGDMSRMSGMSDDALHMAALSGAFSGGKMASDWDPLDPRRM
jgi:phage terminase large subunit